MMIFLKRHFWLLYLAVLAVETRVTCSYLLWANFCHERERKMVLEWSFS